MRPVRWQSLGSAGDARAGVLHLAGTEVRTPTFMPVGTQAAIRTVSPLHLETTGSQIVLANTYTSRSGLARISSRRRGGCTSSRA